MKLAKSIRSCPLINVSYLLSKCLQTVDEPRPKVSKQWPVYLLQTFLSARVHANIELGDWNQIPGLENGHGDITATIQC